MYGILSVVEFVEVEDHTHQAGLLEIEYLNKKTTGLLLRILKSYFETGMYVILDYDICVLKGLIPLRKKGVFLCCHKEEKILVFHGRR